MTTPHDTKEQQPGPDGQDSSSREESIEHIVEMGFTRDQAIEALENCNNDISRAVQYIFAGADAQAQAQTQAMANGSAAGSSDVQTGHYEDTDLATAVQSSLDQQPPSQLGFQPATASTFTSYSQLQNEQESGVMPSEQQQFGPAQREYYEPGQWGVVPVNNNNENSNDSWQHTSSEYAFPSSTESIRLIPRLRSSHTPPLLVPNNEMLYISPLLVILHSVPLARNALLNGSIDLLSDYGFEPNWWKDATIDLSDELGESQSANSKRTLIETQRLMAFLDGGSKRSYTDIVNLATYGVVPESSDALKGVTSTDSPTGRFLEDLLLFWGRDHEFSKIFELGAKSSEDTEVQRFTNLVADVTVDIEKSLYDIIDELVWPSQNTDQTYLDHLGDVVHITLKRDDGNSGIGIDVPATWYPDRYLKEVTPFIGEIRARRREMQNELSKLSKQKFQLSTYMGKDASKLLQITSDYLEEISNIDDRDEQENNRDGDEDDTMENGNSNNGNSEFLAAFEDVNRAKTEFEKRKSDLIQRISDLGDQINFERDLFKGNNPSGLEEIFHDGEKIPELRAYRLCGAIISPTEYCFKSYENNDDLIDLNNDGIESAYSWWRVRPSSDTGEPTAERVSEEDVLTYAKEGSKDYSWQEVILFYANDYALDREKHALDLSDELKKFIDLDKKALIQQVKDEQQRSHKDEILPNSSSQDNLVVIDSPVSHE